MNRRFDRDRRFDRRQNVFFFGGGWPYYPYDYNYSAAPYYPGSYYEQPSETISSGDPVVDVQLFLKRAGYYRGPIDGILGPASRAAMRAYEAQHVYRR